MKEPYIWLKEEEVLGMANCGCELNRDYKSSDNPALFLCPLHENAEELLEAAEKQVALIESEEMKGVLLPIAAAISFKEALNKLRQAILKAERSPK